METKRRTLSPNPCETANFWSKMFYAWVIPTFRTGYRRKLVMDDMYQPLSCHRSECLGDRLGKVWKEQEAKSKKTPLILVVMRTFWTDFLTLSCLFGLQSIVFRVGQSMLLGQFLQYFCEDSDMTYMDALVYGNGIILLNATNAIIVNKYISLGWVVGMKSRIAICSLIYRKALRLSQTALGGTGPGKVVNLLSNDVSRFEILTLSWDALWSAPLLTLIVGILLWRDIGWAGLVGISIMIVAIVIQSLTANLTSKFRSKMAFRSDERIRSMDEIISGVQVIKMYAWEMPFAKLIALARKMELKNVKMMNSIRGVHISLSMFVSRSAVFCTMLSITLLHGTDQITAAKVFEISSYFWSLNYLLSEKFVVGITEASEALVSFQRLQNFLELDEKEQEPIDGGSKADAALAGNVSVSLENVTARWVLPRTTITSENKAKSSDNGDARDIVEKDHVSVALNGLSADLTKGKLIGIIGPVGAGKSSLLQAILRELPLESGSIQINGTISYASQESWIFAGTVRQNIIFGQKYEKDRYDAVVRACALTTDLEQLPEGDKTMVGERGISLSGGQKARINLARATYRRSDIYLLDDPLSAVDAHVGAHIFSKCIGPTGHLADMNATRVLVTHQVHFLEAADWIIVLHDGKIASQGTPSDLMKRGIDFVRETDTDPQKDLTFSHEMSENMPRKSSVRSTSSSSSVHESISSEKDKDKQRQFVSQLEEISFKSDSGSMMMNYLKSGAHWSVLPILFSVFLLTQILASAADIWISIWVKSEEERTLRRNSSQYEPSIFDESSSESSFWNKMLSTEQTTEFYVDVYTILMVAVISLALIRSVGFVLFCVRASKKLHDGMFKGLISTKLRFFDTNPSGRVLNRFAKDIGVIDAFLPRIMLNAAQIIISTVGVMAVVAYVNPILIIPISLLGLIFFLVRRGFLKTSRCIRHLEANAKSPVYTHMAATLNGLSTIRSNHAEDILTKEFDYHQDIHTSCLYMFTMASSAFGLSLDSLVSMFMACTIYFFMVYDDGVSASGNKIGLAITQILSMTAMLQWGVRQSAEISNNMTAVQRVLEYRDLEPEPEPEKPIDVEKDWPSKGSIEFRNVFFRYFAEAEAVLRGLSFVIEPMEKIGIVGRTGAGKSSLIGALFRLACIEGEIIIDGVDTSSVSLKRLRSSIAIIPQDPVLFSGTLRRNLDPFVEYGDADIWNALEKVELREITAGQLGLNSPVLANGSNFSVGQRQLICLARAILRKNRILVLDEATANVDPKTDLLIQETIREKFVECTVLTIAHRLHTIIDSDRILVMDAGRAIEFDDAHTLLQDEQGTFNGMLKALGPMEYKRLAQAAQDKFYTKYTTYL